MSNMKHVVIDRFTGRVVKEEEMPSDIDPREFLRQQMADCPECAAALARGERPQFGHGPEIEAALADSIARRTVFGRRPRWRDLKRRRS